MLMMKFCFLGLLTESLLLTLRINSVLAFNLVSIHSQKNGKLAKRSTCFMTGSFDDNMYDITIPYDAAARLAYEEWRTLYNKGPFDPIRYSTFRANYEAISVANVSAKKAARDSGSEPPRMLGLNQFGDYTAEEYEDLTSSASTTNDDEIVTSAGGSSSPISLFQNAMEAAQFQAGAANALLEAADALAEEELVSVFDFYFFS
jgi:hypothetical protein